MRKIIVFDIRNLQADYAKCFKFMEQIRTSGEVNSILEQCSGYTYSENGGNIFKIACDVEKKELIKLRKQEKLSNNDLLWCFRVRVDKEDDIVNLMQFYLIRQIYKNVYAVLITPDIEYDMKISAYLSFEIEKNRNVVFIKTNDKEVEKYGTVHRLAGSSLKSKKVLKLTRFLPLIEVSRQTYEFLAGTVEMAKKKLEKRRSTNFLWEKTVMSTCDRLFTQFNNKKSTDFLHDKSYIDVINNMTVLTYILFCTFRNHCVDRHNVFDIEKIEQELSDARDIAEGVLQILENIIMHSQKKAGYFSFRIHDKGKTGYLDKNYSKYIGIHENDNNDVFLEMFIADSYSCYGKSINKNILCSQFINNLYERSHYNKELKTFINKFEHLSVRDFFDNNMWNEYNSIADNIIEHYGLLLFDKIISSCNGCFELISTTNFIPSEEQCYSSVDENQNFWGTCYVIPGTQYKVLLPVKERNFRQEYVGMDFYEYPKTIMLEPINQNIALEDVNLKTIIISLNKKIEEKMLTKGNKEEQKRRLIYELSEEIYAVLLKGVKCESPKIAHFLLDKVRGANLVEIIFKACMKALLRIREEVGDEKKIYIAFGKLTKEFITEFCYLMGIYYYKVEDSRTMMNTEMYFWNTDYYEDLVISGQNLRIVHSAMLERALLRGIYPQWLNFINYVWEKYHSYVETNDISNSITMLPYEVLIKDNGKTIFEHVVEKVLKTPFENRELGCMIRKTHVQLAAQIHISEFYNGQTLFLNNYFTNYFSYLLVKDICSHISKHNSCPENLILVGYESYSEMLLVEMSNLLKLYIEKNELINSYNISPYIVCEMGDKKMTLRSEQGSMDEVNSSFYKTIKNSKFILVVPINSTMMTFEKMQNVLNKTLGIEIDNQNNIANYALIVSRDNYLHKGNNKDINCQMTSDERAYWKEKDDHMIVTKGKEIPINYFIEVCAGWEQAFECKLCFPEDSLFEKPLIKTDITGLSPLTQLGEKRKWQKGNNTSKENIKRLKLLSNVLRYNHIKRGENHYLYYFDTTTFFYQNKTAIADWIKSICIQKDEKKKFYNFVVSPLHSTNAGFTEEINKLLFENTAHVIRLDFSKTYRSNFMKQFSYIQILYQNIMQFTQHDKTKVEINFYFVDDEIVSGRTFVRAKSLIEGLFEPFDKRGNIDIHVFKKIFVLINRMSDSSKHNFIEKIDDYESFVDFNVSVIQNHDDFCFMCKLVERANHYKLMSATNIMDKKWGEIEKKFQVKDYTLAEQEEEYRQEKYKNRMMAAHYLEAEMWQVQDNATLEQYFCAILNNLLYKRLYKKNGKIVYNKANQEKFVSFIKTLSRPFFVYRNRAKEAALHLIIAFSECFFGVDIDELWMRLESVIQFECEDMNLTKTRLKEICYFMVEWRTKFDDSTYKLLLDLLEQLADMESNYLIRQKNMIKIFALHNLILEKKYGKEKSEEKERENVEFTLQYALFIKQITNEDADETKSLWVEHLFYMNEEPHAQSSEEGTLFEEMCGCETYFGKSILVENTKILYDGIKVLSEILDKKTWVEYSKFLTVKDNVFCELKDKVKQEILKREKHYTGIQLKYFECVLKYYDLKIDSDKIALEILFFGLMFHMRTEEIQFDIFYRNFYWLIKDITGADAQILMLPNVKDMDAEWFYNDVPCIIYDERQEINRKREIKLQDAPFVDSNCLRDTIYEMDTYSISADRKQVILKYSISTKHKDEKDSVYLILQYSEKQETRKLLLDIRLILLCRSRTITRMKRDFNNNLFQSMWQTKRHNMLLEHFKNVSHINPGEYDALDKNMWFIRKIDSHCRGNKELDEVEKGLRVYKALILKMLADNNISAMYHEILAKRFLCDYVYVNKFTAGGMFSDVEELALVFSKGKGSKNEKKWFECNEKLPKIIIEKEVTDGLLYYIAPNSSGTHLAVISLIQNAYKHGNGKEDIHIYRESAMEIGEFTIDYLCISNGIDKNNIDKTIRRIEEHIIRPITARNTESDDDKCDGITLFSINRYCQKIVETLKKEECKDNFIKFEIRQNRIIFKVPILKGEI